MKTTALKIVKKAGRALLDDVIGGALYAAGVYSFASAAEFAPGGIAGLAVILNHFTDLPIGLCTLAFNVPVILLCFKTLGRTFFLRSLCTMAVSTILLDFVFPLLPVYHGDALMAALFAGALSGAGLALIYAQDSSTGGTDFVILSLRKKMPHLSIGTISLVTDGVVILLGGLAFGRIDAVLQGIVMTAVCTTIIDKITYRFTAGQMVIIITDKGDAIARRIGEQVERGVTAVDAVGTYTGAARRMLLCACSRAEAYRIRSIAYTEDRNALVTFCPFDAAYGLGFQEPPKEA